MYVHVFMCAYVCECAQEVGYLFDGEGILQLASSSSVSAMVFDGVVQLQGIQSIIGRSVIIHGNGSLASAYSAQVTLTQPPATP